VSTDRIYGEPSRGGWSMASVEVFVDDAVRGRLPAVCATTGAPAEGKFRIDQFQGGLGAAWLLVFLGPLGLIALFVLALTSRREVLTVRLPWTVAAADRELRLLRTRVVSIFTAVVFALLLVSRWVPLFDPLCAIAALAGCVAAVVAQIRLSLRRVGVRLDASRRWVTLTNAHPAFVEAVEHQAAATVSLSATKRLTEQHGV
jgi:hypothetical protein